MAKTKTKTKDEEQTSSGVSVILIIAIGIAVLAGLYVWGTTWREDAEQARELPLVSIVVEVDRFDPSARAQIVQLENGLRACGAFGNPAGPGDTKFLLPGANPGDVPVAKGFADMTDDEWSKAWSYIAKTDYLVPRMFRLDGTACVIRLDAKGGAREFAADAGSKLEQACEPFRGKFKGFHVYSSELGVGTVHDRDVLNASFGCQLSWILIDKPASASGKITVWPNAAGIKALSEAKDVIEKKNFRSVTTAANYVRYYWTVALEKESEVDVPDKDADVKLALDFAKANKIPTYISADGRKAIVDTTTDLEGQANAELVYYLAAALEAALKVECTTNYQPVPEHPIRNEPTLVLPH